MSQKNVDQGQNIKGDQMDRKKKATNILKFPQNIFKRIFSFFSEKLREQNKKNKKNTLKKM